MSRGRGAGIYRVDTKTNNAIVNDTSYLTNSLYVAIIMFMVTPVPLEAYHVREQDN